MRVKLGPWTAAALLAGPLLLLLATTAHAAGPPQIDGNLVDWQGRPSITLPGTGGPSALTLSWFTDFSSHTTSFMVLAPGIVPDGQPLRLTVQTDTNLNGSFADPADRIAFFTCAPGLGSRSYAAYDVRKRDGTVIKSGQDLPDAAASGTGRGCEWRLDFSALGLADGEEGRLSFGAAEYTDGQWMTTVSSEVAWQRLPTLGPVLLTLLCGATLALSARRVGRGGTGS